MRKSLICILVLITPIFHLGNGLSIKENTNILISDGVKEGGNLEATTVTCEPSYEFLPCTTTFWGLFFMLIVYEILLSLGGQYVSRGSDLFFKTFGTGFFGASLFHILGTIPQVSLVLVNGIIGSSEAAQTSAGMSMGLLAGSTIFSVTLIWGCVIAIGSKKFSNGNGYGVKTDKATQIFAGIMLISMIPFLILQLARVFHPSSGKHVLVLVSLVVSVVVLLGFYIYQVFCPRTINERTLECVMCKYANNEEESTSDEERSLTARESTLVEERNRNLQESTSDEEQSLKAREKIWNCTKASGLLFLGIAISLGLALPLMQTIGELSTALNIPSFWVSYVVIPWALNFRQAILAITSAKRKTRRMISLTFSKIYIGVFLNNMLGLITFLSLVLSRNLSWDMSTEVLVVLVICLVVGLCARFITKFPFWTGIVAVLLYPILLIILYVLTTVFG